MARKKSLRMKGKPGRGEVVTIKHLLLAALILTLMIAGFQAGASLAPKDGEKIELDIQGNIMDLKDTSPTIDEVVNSRRKVVLFWEQENCAGCKVLRPLVAKAAPEYNDTLFVRVHIDKIYEKNLTYGLMILQEYQVLGTPTLIVYVDGVETGRQVGLFPVTGDQYQALIDFLENSLSKRPLKPRSMDQQNSDGSGGAGVTGVEERSSPLADPLKGLGLGLLAAFAPCSVPMIAAFASREAGRGSRGMGRYVYTLLLIAGVTLTLGFALTALYIASFLFTRINPFAIVVVYAGSFIAVWGLLNLMGKEPMIGGRATSSILFPVMGLQCSLPFLILAMTSIAAEPLNVVATGIAFALGYSLPYVASAYGARQLASRILKATSSPLALRIQGLILLGAGIYLIVETYSLGLVNLG
ncbi:MAG: thioredoxin domain-containing protein [Desulfurococcales archaeon]|nr:thioredoxin domain-containing protein [Desulfurococcales archaeon]